MATPAPWRHWWSPGYCPTGAMPLTRTPTPAAPPAKTQDRTTKTALIPPRGPQRHRPIPRTPTRATRSRLDIDADAAGQGASQTTVFFASPTADPDRSCCTRRRPPQQPGLGKRGLVSGSPASLSSPVSDRRAHSTNLHPGPPQATPRWSPMETHHRYHRRSTM